MPWSDIPGNPEAAPDDKVLTIKADGTPHLTPVSALPPLVFPPSSIISGAPPIVLTGLPVGALVALVANFFGAADGGAVTALSIKANGTTIATRSLLKALVDASARNDPDYGLVTDKTFAYLPMSLTAAYTVAVAGDFSFSLTAPGSGNTSLLAIRLR